MKITTTEVKTFYSISIEFKDWVNAIENYKAKEAPKICHPRAFETFNIEDTTMGNLRNGFRRIDPIGNKDTFEYLARFLGFDGWQNAGIFNERTQTHNMVVYNRGDTVNI